MQAWRRSGHTTRAVPKDSVGVQKAKSLTGIVGRAAVVRRRKQGDQVALGEAFKAVHDALVRADDHLQVVLLLSGVGSGKKSRGCGLEDGRRLVWEKSSPTPSSLLPSAPTRLPRRLISPDPDARLS
jgi:hypothetical protein